MLFVLRQDRLERPNRSQIPPSHRTTRTASRPAVPVPHPRLRCVSTQRQITALNQDFKGARDPFDRNRLAPAATSVLAVQYLPEVWSPRRQKLREADRL